MSNEKKSISDAAIRRFPRYYRYLGELEASGITRISSQELAEKMGLTGSQIRQDFNHFGGFGQQGYGYKIEVLREEIGKILGIDKSKNVIVIGAGNLGQALIGYAGFSHYGFKLTGIFDISEKVIGTQMRDLTVLPMEDLEDFLKTNIVDIAVLTVPASAAAEICEKLCSLGVKGIWNFAHTDLTVPSGVTVVNAHLTDSLMQLCFRMNCDQIN